MDNKKIKIFIGSGLLLVLLLLGLYSLGDIKYSVKEGLSYEEKKRDAKYLMDFLENTYPYFEEIKADSGQDILKEKSKIISSIAKTSSDEEFFAEISELFKRFKYGRVDFNIVGEPFSYDYTHLDKKLGLTAETYRNKFMEGKLKWEPIVKKHWESFFTPNFSSSINAIYFDGDYYITMSQNPDVHIGDKIIGVDGITVDEYIKKLSNDKYSKVYDYDREKYAIYSLFTAINKAPKEILIKDSTGTEKKVEVLPFDSNKPILENAFKAFESWDNVVMKENDKENFLSSFEQGKILALNFSAFEDTHRYQVDSNKKEDLFSYISQSNYLLLDLRNGANDAILTEVLDFISPKAIEYSNYKVIKKNEFSDDYINYSKSYMMKSITEVTSLIESLEKVYPLSKYHIFKEQILKLNGPNKYKGKVFILYDKNFSSSPTCEILKAVIDHNIATVISNGKIRLLDYNLNSPNISLMLPNSNINLTVQTAKIVNENGMIIGKTAVTPQMIIKEDTSRVIEDLKRGEGFRNKINSQDRYTSKDEYFNEVLKLID